MLLHILTSLLWLFLDQSVLLCTGQLPVSCLSSDTILVAYGCLHLPMVCCPLLRTGTGTLPLIHTCPRTTTSQTSRRASGPASWLCRRSWACQSTLISRSSRSLGAWTTRRVLTLSCRQVAPAETSPCVTPGRVVHNGCWLRCCYCAMECCSLYKLKLVKAACSFSHVRMRPGCFAFLLAPQLARLLPWCPQPECCTTYRCVSQLSHMSNGVYDLVIVQAAPWMMSQGVQLVCLGTGSTDLEVRAHACGRDGVCSIPRTRCIWHWLCARCTFWVTGGAWLAGD